jgi:tetratricopeptide (TPR) repeat protein
LDRNLEPASLRSDGWPRCTAPTHSASTASAPTWAPGLLKLVGLAGILLSGLVSTAHLTAQDAAGRGVAFPTESEYQILWQRLEQSRREEDWAAVLSGLDSYTDLVQRADVNPVVESGGGLALGLHTLLQQLPAALPEDARRRFQERLDAVVSQVWRHSHDTASPEEHRRLRHRLLRDYPMTSLRAAVLKEDIDEAFADARLGTARTRCESLLELDPDGFSEVTRDDLARARLYLLQILALESPTASTVADAETHLTALVVLAESHRAQLAPTTLEQITSALAAAETLSRDLTVGNPAARGLTTDISARTHRALELEMFSAGREVPESTYQIGDLLWHESVDTPHLRRFIEERSRVSSDAESVLAYHSAQSEKLLVFQHVDQLVAVDLKKRQTAWRHPLPPEAENLVGLRVPLLGFRHCFFVSGATLGALLLNDGSMSWAITVRYDTEAKAPIFSPRVPTDDAAEIQPEETRKPESPPEETQEEGEGEGGAGENQAEEEQEVEAAGPADETHSTVAGSVARLTPPVFYQDRIVVGIRYQIDGESLHYIAAFDTAGKTIWTRYLGSVAGDDYLGLGSTGSLPLIADETIYYLTNQGFLVALDPVDGVILWISEYARLEPAGKREAIRRADRWHPNPLIAVGTEVVLAPQDSPFLLAVRRRDGAFSWRSPRQRHGTLIGAGPEACIVAGTEVAAIAHSGEARGQVLWRYGAMSEPRGSRRFVPLGRAVLAGDVIFLSGRHAIVRLSTADGSVLSKTLWDFESGGGNLLLSAKSLAVTTPEGLFIYGPRRAPDASLTADLNTLNHASLLARALFHLRNYAVQEGLAALRRWSETSPPSPVPNSELDHLQLDLAETCRFLSETEDGASFRKELLRARLELERNPQRKVRSAIELAESLLDGGDKAAALGLFHAALSYDNPPTEYSPDGILVVRSESYLRGRIAALRRSTPKPEEAFAETESRANAALAEARKNGTPPSYVEVLRHYPYTAAAAQAYLDLFTCHQDRKNYTQGLRTLEEYLRDFEPGNPQSVALPGGNISGLVRVKLIVANMLYQAKRGAEASVHYREVLANYGDLKIDGVRDMTSGETVREYVRLRLRDPGLRNLADKEPADLRLPVRMAWRAPAELSTTNRTFLEPEGPTPPGLERCFLTQAATLVECRSIDTGLPVWRVHLDMIPGFETEPMARLRSRTGPRAFRSLYAGDLLLLQDTYNVAAIDASQGHVRWHLPFGNQDPKRRTAGNPLRRLRESVRGSALTPEGVFIATSRTLYHHKVEGERVWHIDLDYEAGLHPLFVHDNRLFVFSQRPIGLRVHDTTTGELQVTYGADQELDQRLVSHPILTRSDQLLLHFERELKLFSLAESRTVWRYKLERKAQLESVTYSPDAPHESVVFLRRQNNWPAMVGVALNDGRERWRYEKFPARDGTFTLFRDGDQFFVIHGDDQWHLLALELRAGPDVDAPSLVPIWPNEVRLGHFYAGSSSRRLHMATDAVLFADATGTALRIFDRARGVRRASDARVIGRFLVEKRSFASSRVAEKLIVLTDNGDAAFETAIRGRPTDAPTGVEITAVDRFLESPGDFETTRQLALEYFVDDDLASAIEVLNRSLLSEDLLIKADRTERQLLKLLLDGITQENMKREVPEIVCRRMRSPPKIDGELNDAWHLTTRIRLDSPTHIGSIPIPDQVHEWDGAEDLSATLYTGWDENNFYLALDVSDDILIPFNRDADNWTGDCLVMGLDPTGDGGYRHRGNDQLMTLALTVPKRNPLDKDKDKNGKDGEDEEAEEEEKKRKPDGLFSVKKKGDDSGAIYEVALPWESFSQDFEDGHKPQEGYSFGLSLLLTDDDTLHGNQGQGATKTLSVNPCHLLPRNQTQGWVWRYLIPNFFPRVRLE